MDSITEATDCQLILMTISALSTTCKCWDVSVYLKTLKFDGKFGKVFFLLPSKPFYDPSAGAPRTTLRVACLLLDIMFFNLKKVVKKKKKSNCLLKIN